MGEIKALNPWQSYLDYFGLVLIAPMPEASGQSEMIGTEAGN